MSEGKVLIENAKAFSEAVEGQALELLKELVLINSWTYNKKGVDAVVERIADFFPDGPFRKRIVEQDELGNHLIVDTSGVGEENFILMVGHTDTVFPPDMGFNCFEDEGEIVRGPGVIDMKGGLVVGMYALTFLHNLGLERDIPVRFIFNSDEEIGSPSSRKLLKDSADRASCGLVFECGGLDNTVVTGRRGKIGVVVHIKGESGHAGMVKEGKKSAVLELAHKIIAFERLNELGEDVNCNVGKVSGGVAPNVIPEYAEMHVDLRYLKVYNREKILRKIEEIVEISFVNGVNSSFEVVSERPAMERNEINLKLFERARKVAEILGVAIKEEVRYGVSDANIISQSGIPVLDGLGPIGDNDHSEKEYMIKRSLKERIALAALLLLDLGGRFDF